MSLIIIEVIAAHGERAASPSRHRSLVPSRSRALNASLHGGGPSLLRGSMCRSAWPSGCCLLHIPPILITLVLVVGAAVSAIGAIWVAPDGSVPTELCTYFSPNLLSAMR